MSKHRIYKLTVVSYIAGLEYNVGVNCTDVYKKDDGSYNVWFKDGSHENYSNNFQFAVMYYKPNETSK